MNKWRLVGLLWFCGFFNYADRQSLAAVKPILQTKMGLSDAKLGTIDSAFMIAYAFCAPLAGRLVDRASRKKLVVLGLGFWSLVAIATGAARSYDELLFVRAIEGLGEAFYFPASMSLLAAFHDGTTRSRAMSLHQTSVYAGTALGGFVAAILARRHGWQAPFSTFGALGLAYAAFLSLRLVEPLREASSRGEGSATFRDVLNEPAARPLLFAFAGANFAAMGLMSWIYHYIYKSFPDLDVFRSAWIGNVVLPAANVLGVLIGGRLGDDWARRFAKGRALPQGIALLCGAPFIAIAGLTGSSTILIGSLGAIGLCKGVYDAGIFASIYDVVPVRARGTAAGLMNAFAWIGAAPAPTVLGILGERIGLGAALATTASAYAIAGGVVLWSLARRKPLSADRSNG